MNDLILNNMRNRLAEGISNVKSRKRSSGLVVFSPSRIAAISSTSGSWSRNPEDFLEFTPNTPDNLIRSFSSDALLMNTGDATDEILKEMQSQEEALITIAYDNHSKGNTKHGTT